MTVHDYGARFSASALEQTLAQNYGAGVDADLPESLRFVRGVATLAKKRFREGVEGPCGHALVFILHPEEPPETKPERQRKRVPMIDNGLSALGGRIWFVNYAVTEAVSMEVFGGEDDAALFDLLRDEIGVGNLPAAVVETRSDLFELRYFPEGLSFPEKREVTDLSRRFISPAEVRKTLDEIYDAELCTPSAQTQRTSTWVKATAHWASSDAELRIQRVLKVGLGREFKGCLVRQEQNQVTGRLDLEIEEPHEDDRSTVTRHMLLELKVLRERDCDGRHQSDEKNSQAISEGLDQARAYRDEREVRSAALCCYDMRAIYRGPEVTFDDVVDQAAEWAVELWLWHLFGRNRDYRRHIRPQAQDVSARAGTDA